MPHHAHLTSGSLLFWLVLLIGIGITAIGVRVILAPRESAKDFGVPVGENEAFTYIWAAGARDIVFGLLTIALLWLKVSPVVLAVFIFIASLIPIGDLVNVYVHAGTSKIAPIVIHGGGILFMWLLGFLLLRA